MTLLSQQIYPPPEPLLISGKVPENFPPENVTDIATQSTTSSTEIGESASMGADHIVSASRAAGGEKSNDVNVKKRSINKPAASSIKKSNTTHAKKSPPAPVHPPPTAVIQSSTTVSRKQSSTTPITEPSTTSTKKSATVPVEKLATDPVKKSATAPVKKLATDPVKKLVTDPLKKSATAPVKKSTTAPLTKLVTVPVKKSATALVKNLTTASTVSSNVSTKEPPPATSLIPKKSSPISEGFLEDQNDDEVTSLKATIAQMAAELDKAKKSEAAKPKAEATEPIPKPTGRYNLRDAMGLATNRMLYNSCRAAVNTAIIEVKFPVDSDWRKQDRQLVLRVMELAKEGQPHLKRYEKAWATEDIMVSICKNKRNYKSKCRRGYVSRRTGSAQGKTGGENEDSSVDNGSGGEETDIEDENQIFPAEPDSDEPMEESESGTKASGSKNTSEFELEGCDELLVPETAADYESEAPEQEDEEMKGVESDDNRDVGSIEGTKDMESDDDGGIDEDALKVVRRSLKRRCDEFAENRRPEANRGGKRRKKN
ncbi:hypothetical protein Agabi119p4_9108 [Agaricus bisporus var. burnettii]|uniref:Uncharacterized protein n=1 Tax=Agaricus bisporus var. burnettii TaxID=192524 RepID=A0A8H7C5Q0_AGABI|nr:hypothetical protein Agabi119p4_9108 [Agaricus bisporus var. burnettii]